MSNDGITETRVVICSQRRHNHFVLCMATTAATAKWSSAFVEGLNGEWIPAF